MSKYRFVGDDITGKDKEARAYVRAFSLAEIDSIVHLGQIFDWEAWRHSSQTEAFISQLKSRLVQVDMDIVEAIQQIDGGGDWTTVKIDEMTQTLDDIRQELTNIREQGETGLVSSWLSYLNQLTQVIRDEFIDTIGDTIAEVFGGLSQVIPQEISDGIGQVAEESIDSTLQITDILAKTSGFAAIVQQLDRIADSLENKSSELQSVGNVSNATYVYYQNDDSQVTATKNGKKVVALNEDGDPQIGDNGHIMHWLGMTAAEVAKFVIKVSDTDLTELADREGFYNLRYRAKWFDDAAQTTRELLIDESNLLNFIIFPSLGVSAPTYYSLLKPNMSYLGQIDYESILLSVSAEITAQALGWTPPVNIPVDWLVELVAEDGGGAGSNPPHRAVDSMVKREWKDDGRLQRPPKYTVAPSP